MALACATALDALVSAAAALCDTLATALDALVSAAAALSDTLATAADIESCAKDCTEATALAEASWSCEFDWPSIETDPCAVKSALLKEEIVPMGSDPIITFSCRTCTMCAFGVGGDGDRGGGMACGV